jgi:hypothetical protein
MIHAHGRRKESVNFVPCRAAILFSGKKNRVEQVPEIRVEMVCRDIYIKSVLSKLLAVHPYETPAYSVWEIKTIKDFV